MPRISIDTLGLSSPRGTTFPAASKRRRRPWYSSRPRLIVTVLFFALLWTYLNYGGTPILIPEDSYQELVDESLRDILNSTLGVGGFVDLVELYKFGMPLFLPDKPVLEHVCRIPQIKYHHHYGVPPRLTHILSSLKPISLFPHGTAKRGRIRY